MLMALWMADGPLYKIGANAHYHVVAVDNIYKEYVSPLNEEEEIALVLLLLIDLVMKNHVLISYMKKQKRQSPH